MQNARSTSGYFRTPAAAGLLTGTLAAGLWNLVSVAKFYWTNSPWLIGFVLLATYTICLQAPGIAFRNSAHIRPAFRWAFWIWLVQMPFPIACFFSPWRYSYTFLFEHYLLISFLTQALAGAMLGHALVRMYSVRNATGACMALGALGASLNAPVTLWYTLVYSDSDIDPSHEFLALWQMLYLLCFVAAVFLPSLLIEHRMARVRREARAEPVEVSP